MAAENSHREPVRRAELTSITTRVRAVYESGRTRPLEWRREQLDGLIRMLDRENETIVDALAADLGKPRLEGWAADIAATAADVRHLRRHLPRWARPRRAALSPTSRPGRAVVVPEPLGVALVIAPWNYPVQLLVQPMAAAIAAGNTVVGKPSELAPATSEALARLIPRHVDPEAIAVVEGDAAVATALLDEAWDHIFFTGNTAVGRSVLAAAAADLTPVVLELGGKCPVFVDDTAALGVTSRRIAWGKWINAGQTCIAPDYVLVGERLRDELVDGIADALRLFAAGSVRTTPDYARIVNEQHARRLERLLADHGGRVVVGGEVDVTARYVSPTVIVDPDIDSPLMVEEIFGPILPVVTIESADAAIGFVNSRPRPLALYVFCEDSDVADRLVASTSSGGVVVNHVLLQKTPELPFGGVGPSGSGRYHGRTGFDAHSNLKTVLRKPTKPDPSIIYPPYTRLKERIIRRFL
jgi:aldehyde dehydrogenase (NAD+)